ncbi:MAG: hypothetical protein V5A79_05730 [Candidatus Bipolaricaulota bacterium]
MVLEQLTQEEIEALKGTDRKGLDYEKRLKELLNTYSVYPVLDRPLQGELSRYLEKVEEESPTREEYLRRLEELLEKEG